MDSPSLQELLTSCRQAWAVEWADGPASRWPRLAPRPDLAQYCQDRQGFGVPEESLPMALACYSVCGWRLTDRLGRLCLEPGCPAPVNAEGCRRHLAIQTRAAAEAFIAWTKLQVALEEMATHQPKTSQKSQSSQPSCDKNVASPRNQPQAHKQPASAGQGWAPPPAPSSAEDPNTPPRRPKWAPKLAPRPATKPMP